MQLTERIIDIFKAMSQIPRQSKHEEKISAWLVERAKADGFAVDCDDVRNVIVHVPATPGYEKAPILIMQGHMDMVCEKTPDSSHNFATDPIEVILGEDGWMHANHTTLGADDGIGVATALAIAEDKSIEHPELELLFTIDEETGMTGAEALKIEQLKGRILLNLDSEDEGVFTVGSAGGRETVGHIPLNRAPLMAGARAVTITVSGLLGGHSGCEIHCGRANAIKLVVRIANAVLEMIPDARLVDIKGGSAHNAIPRDAHIVIAVPGKDAASVTDLAHKMGEQFASEFKSTDAAVKVDAKVADIAGDAYDARTLRNIVDFLLVYPHGIAAMSHDIDGLVETSDNLASIRIENNELISLSSQRSSVPTKLNTLTARIEAAIRLAGGKAKSSEGYPAWQPNMDSDVLKRCVAAYKARFGHEPKVEIIHAGLECSIIGSKFLDMDMISFGATVVSPHTPKERCEIKTIGMVADFLVDLLKGYK